MPDALELGIKKIKNAIQLDVSEKYDEAFVLYRSGIQYLLAALKEEKDEATKKAIQYKCDKYLARAEEIKKMSEALKS